MEIETHPHSPFSPLPLKTLIVGSFPGRADTLSKDPANNWFYSAVRSQFWKIMTLALELPLPDTNAKMAALSSRGIGIADILLQISRKKATNADQDLIVIAYNKKAFSKILKDHPNVRVCFTSRFVEKHFIKCFPDYTNTCLLPSPSARYAKLSLQQKAAVYKELLLG